MATLRLHVGLDLEPHVRVVVDRGLGELVLGARAGEERSAVTWISVLERREIELGVVAGTDLDGVEATRSVVQAVVTRKLDAMTKRTARMAKPGYSARE